MKLTGITFFILILTASFYANTHNITVNISSPQSGVRFQSCTDITIQAEATIQTGTLGRVYFYADGKYIGFDRNSPYELIWKNVPNGIYKLTAHADTAISDPVTIFVDPIENGDMVKNGEFVCRKWPWVLENREGAKSSWQIIPWDRLSDTTAAEVKIETSTETFWHVQLKQDVGLISGHTYEISFLAEVENEKNIEVGLQQKEEPFDTYWSVPVKISGILDTSFTWESDVTDPQTEFKFSVGDNAQTIVLDAAKIIDQNWIPHTAIHEKKPKQVTSSFQLYQNYPNPFNPTTSIRYMVGSTKSSSLGIDLSIYNALGEKIAILHSGHQKPGDYYIKWDASSFPSGVYYYKITTGDYAQTRKMILVK